MKLVIIESPYSGNVGRNVRYARACLRDSLQREEAPFASHLLYTQDGVLQDEVMDERAWGMRAGFCWGEKADLTAVYTDLGISEGMREGMKAAEYARRTIEFRNVAGWEFG